MVSATIPMNYKRKKDDDDTFDSLSSSSFGTSGRNNTAMMTNTHRSTSAAVIYSPRTNNNNNGATGWTHCKSRLHTLLRQYNDESTGGNNYKDDPILDDIATISTALNVWKNGGNTDKHNHHHQQLQMADHVVSTLKSEMNHIQQQIQTTSTMVGSLQEQYNTLHKQAMSMIDEMDAVRQQQLTIRRYIDETNVQMHDYQQEIVSSQKQLFQSVPRLQHQISLYVSMTGIKWKYDTDTDSSNNHDDDADKWTLTGEINIPSKKIVRRFHIDGTKLLPPSSSSYNLCNNDQRRYNVAQQLWKIIEGSNTVE